MATLQDITSEDAFNSFTQSASPTSLLVLYFHAPWAAPCAQMKTILTALASTYPSDNSISFLSINAEDLSDISENYDVSAVPFLVLQRGGKTLETVSGSDASKVRAAVERHAGGSAAGKAGIPPPLQATPQTNGTSTTTSNPPSQTKSAHPSAESDKEELNARLAKLVKAAPVMLFMKGTPNAPECGFSRQLVGMLRENEVKYGFFNILADEDVRQGLKEFSEWPTFPQLYTNGELVGGLDIVKEEMDADPDFFKPFSAKAEAGTATA